MDDEERAVLLTAIMREYPSNWRTFAAMSDGDALALCALKGYALVLPGLVEAGSVAMEDLRLVHQEVRRRMAYLTKKRRSIPCE